MQIRTIRAAIVLADGRQSHQRFEVQGTNDAEFDRLSRVFAQGVLTVAAMFREEAILSLKIGWADQWDQIPETAPRAAHVN